MKNLMMNLVHQLKSKKYEKLAFILALTGFGVLALVAYGDELFFPGNEQAQTVFRQVGMIIFLLLGCGVGLLAMIREEFLQIVMIRGRAAQMIGLIMLLTGMSLTIYIIWYMTQP